MSEKPKRKRSPRRVYLIAATLLIPILALQILFSRSVDVWKSETNGYAASPFASPVRIESTSQAQYNGLEARETIGELVGNAFPLSADNFAYETINRRQASAKMRFDLAPEDLDNWFNYINAGCSELKFQELPFTWYWVDEDFKPVEPLWWQPRLAVFYASASCEMPQVSHHLTVFIDMTQNNSWTVYLEIW
jgi:hypothetical protein